MLGWGTVADPSELGLVVFVPLSFFRTVAVFQTLPETIMSASDTGGCCSTSSSRRRYKAAQLRPEMASQAMGSAVSHFVPGIG